MDSVLYQQALSARGVSLCSYLVSLAAFQKGLQVSFYRKGEFPYKGLGIGIHGGMPFSVSDGERVFYFVRTKGSLTSYEASNNVRDKYKTKEVLQKNSVLCPKGGVYRISEVLENSNFFSDFGASYLVAKPVSGSGGKGVYTGIDSQEKLSHALGYSNKKGLSLIEEQVFGDEYRFYVVGDEVVAVYSREAANVVGDGLNTIEQLVKIKNKSRDKNPHLSSRKIQLNAEAVNFLWEQGVELGTVIPNGMKVYLSRAANLAQGGENIDRTDAVSEYSKSVAVKAVEALGLPNAGVDIIISRLHGEDEKCYILEVNAAAMIGSHTFPVNDKGQGNLVAEKIINRYFPEAREACRNIYYDYETVRKLISSGTVSHVTLPIISNLEVRKFFLLSSEGSKVSRNKLFTEMKKLGCYGDFYLIGEDHVFVRLAVSKRKSRGLDRIVSSSGYKVLKKGAVSSVMFARFKKHDKSRSIDANKKLGAKIIVSGDVQGVGYRRWAVKLAKELFLKGWVRNLSDGRVEAFIAGDESAIELFEALCWEGPKRALVGSVSRKNYKYKDFETVKVRKTI